MKDLSNKVIVLKYKIFNIVFVCLFIVEHYNAVGI